MLHIVWRFRAKPEWLEEFRRNYAAEGEWTKLFRKSPDYRGTSFWVDDSDPLSFLVIDDWTSHEAFVRFRQEYAAAYEALDRYCEELTDEELMIGMFSDQH